MTPDEARGILESWLDSQADNDYGPAIPIKLPIKDRVIYKVVRGDKKVLEEWTFIGLLKVAYGL